MNWRGGGLDWSEVLVFSLVMFFCWSGWISTKLYSEGAWLAVSNGWTNEAFLLADILSRKSRFCGWWQWTNETSWPSVMWSWISWIWLSGGCVFDFLFVFLGMVRCILIGAELLLLIKKKKGLPLSLSEITLRVPFSLMAFLGFEENAPRLIILHFL